MTCMRSIIIYYSSDIQGVHKVRVHSVCIFILKCTRTLWTPCIYLKLFLYSFASKVIKLKDFLVFSQLSALAFLVKLKLSHKSGETTDALIALLMHRAGQRCFELCYDFLGVDHEGRQTCQSSQLIAIAKLFHNVLIAWKHSLGPVYTVRTKLQKFLHSYIFTSTQYNTA